MSRLRRVSGVAWAVATALVALVASLVPLVFQLVPAWKPDPRDKVSADISVIAVEPHASLRTWLSRQYPGDAGARERILGHKGVVPGELAFPGEVVYVRMEVSGSKGRAVRLRARLYRARQQQPLVIPSGSEQNFGGRAAAVRIDAPSRSSVQLLFIDDLSQTPLPIFVRVELFNDDGILAVADSPILRNGREVTKPVR